jgi:deaminated glutathione amidase
MANQKLRVAAVQLQSEDDVLVNLLRCRQQLERACDEGAQLIVLPENFAYFGPEAGKRSLAEALPRPNSVPVSSESPASESLASESPGPIFQFLSQFARERRVTLVGGGFPEQSADPERPYNSAVVVNPEGEVAAVYRKLHLFDATLTSGQTYRESDATTAGDALVQTEVAGFQLGLSICYDLRFPELYLALARGGAEVMLVPAAFTYETGAAHWHVLLRARAIECQAWVIAAAQCGTHPGARRTYGHAMVVDPWGSVLAECVDGSGVALADLDRDVLDSVRRRLPCAQHRRL